MLLAVLVSLGAGIVSYFLISSLMLWTINVADEEGHGPDPGSLEWQNAITKTAETRHNRDVTLAVAISILSLPACLSLTRQLTHRNGFSSRG
ncbi:MAG: hypothetical protein SFW36_10915 [Leptolyngbyaceae cyanobacterium bins.59]|nr:hypothetical protein [Leptolyngbyaceae cyanobacterium bins.59]